MTDSGDRSSAGVGSEGMVSVGGRGPGVEDGVSFSSDREESEGAKDLFGDRKAEEDRTSGRLTTGDVDRAFTSSCSCSSSSSSASTLTSIPPSCNGGTNPSPIPRADMPSGKAGTGGGCLPAPAPLDRDGLILTSPTEPSVIPDNLLEDFAFTPPDEPTSPTSINLLIW